MAIKVMSIAWPFETKKSERLLIVYVELCQPQTCLGLP